VVIGQRLTPDGHCEGGVEAFGFLKFEPRGRIFEAVQQKQAPLERRLGAARTGVRKVHDPERTLHDAMLGWTGMMLRNRVVRGHWLARGYDESDGHRDTDASGQVPHSCSPVRICVPAQALLGQHGEGAVTEDFLYGPVDLRILRRPVAHYHH
jgi:hypothetical protein